MEGPHVEEGSVGGTHSRASARGQRRLANREREREREVKDSEKLRVRREIRVKVKTKHMTTKVRGLGC